MTFIDKNEWDKFVEANRDPYGAGCVRFAEKWANMMEEKIDSGCRLADIADQTSHDADTEGITGFMYGCAVSVLARVWKYGDELRRWHNGEYGYDGDGTVNPAILTVKSK